MSRLELAVTPGLSFHFAAQSAVLAAEIASYLGSGDGRGATAEETVVVVEAAPAPGAPGGAAGAGELVVAEEGLEVRRRGPVTTFEKHGILGWVDAGTGRGGILADTPSPSAARDFVSLGLAPLLIELAEPRGWLGLHAAAVAVDGRGIVLPGASGAGKSTIFRNSHRAGLDVLSDDLVWLTAEPAAGFAVRPFPRGFSTFDEEGPVPPPTLWRAPVAALVCPVIADRETSRLVSWSAPRALDVLVAESAFLRPAAGDRFRALVRLVGAVPCYRLEAGRRRDEVPRLLASL